MKQVVVRFRLGIGGRSLRSESEFQKLQREVDRDCSVNDRTTETARVVESVCQNSSVLIKSPNFQWKTPRIGTTNMQLAKTSNNERSSTSRNF